MDHHTNIVDQSTQNPTVTVKETLKGYCMDTGVLNIVLK